MGSVLLRPFYKVRLEQAEEIVADGPVLMLPKHQSNLDIPLGYSALTKVTGRHAWCLIKSSLARPMFMGFFWKIGGIPVERADPKVSKNLLLFARDVLYRRDLSGHKPGPGNVMVLFPEQHRLWRTMGEGKQAGFRFLVGKPEQPLVCYSVGYEYRSGFPRNELIVRVGPARRFSADTDSALFLHERMIEIAELSGLSYDFPAPKARKGK
jgi:1-acyl-sn-glycerol-3-phosphate acyltransferase